MPGFLIPSAAWGCGDYTGTVGRASLCPASLYPPPHGDAATTLQAATTLAL
jgi:hypothetical protein